MEGSLLENATFSSSRMHGSSFDSHEFRDPDKYDFRCTRASRRQYRAPQSSLLDPSLIRPRHSRGAGRVQKARENSTSTNCQMEETDNLKRKKVMRRLGTRSSQFAPINNTVRASPTMRQQHHQQQQQQQQQKAYQELRSRTTPSFRCYIDLDMLITSIQALYRGYAVRKCEPVKHLRIIARVREEMRTMVEKAVEVEQYDRLCCDQVEQLRWSEALMALLLRLDSIQDVHPVVREIRKSVVHEVTHFQTLIDSALEYSLHYGNKRPPPAQAKEVKTDNNIQALENENNAHREHHPVSLQISDMEPLGAAKTVLKNWCSIVWELVKDPDIQSGMENLEKEVSLVDNQMGSASVSKDTPASASSSRLIKDEECFLIRPSLSDASIVGMETHADSLSEAQKENEPNAALGEWEEVNVIMQTVPCPMNIKEKHEGVEATVLHELDQGGQKPTLGEEDLSLSNFGALEKGEELLREDKHAVSNNEDSAKAHVLREGIPTQADVGVATPATPAVECIEANGNKVLDPLTTESFGGPSATPSYFITSPCPTPHLSESEMDGVTKGIRNSQKQDRSITENDPTKDVCSESLDLVTALSACPPHGSAHYHSNVQLGSLYPPSSEEVSDSMLIQHILEENHKLRAVIGEVLQWGKQQTAIIHNLASRIEQLEAIVLAGKSLKKILDSGESIDVINAMTKEENATEHSYHHGAKWEGRERFYHLEDENSPVEEPENFS
ncbi:unnamed protein product [Sphagnum jensenii]|uniref:BAG domain-containing protein n=1 Tax=Sphagnum jensenii TaxID=128206 RepID=A0ABP1ARM6_9BRYO